VPSSEQHLESIYGPTSWPHAKRAQRTRAPCDDAALSRLLGRPSPPCALLSNDARSCPATATSESAALLAVSETSVPDGASGMLASSWPPSSSEGVPCPSAPAPEEAAPSSAAPGAPEAAASSGAASLKHQYSLNGITS
jgi:hypothetical protein